MKLLLAALAVLVAVPIAVPAFAQELPVFNSRQESTVVGSLKDGLIVANGGASFICDLRYYDAAIVFQDCMPIVSSDAYERYKSATGGSGASKDAESLAATAAVTDGRHWDLDGYGPVGEQQIADMAVAFFEDNGCRVSIADTEAVANELLDSMFIRLGLDPNDGNNRKALLRAIDAVFETLMVNQMILIDANARTATLADCSR